MKQRATFRWAAGILTSTLMLLSTNAQTNLESIALTHQAPQAIVEKISPQLVPGEFITASGKGVLLTADAQRLAVLRQQILALDQPIRRVLLEARVGRLDQLTKAETGATDISIANRGAQSVVMISGASGPAELRVLSQSLDMEEGKRSTLALGQSEGLLLKTTTSVVGKSTFTNSAVKLDAQSGAWIALYFSGDEVLLEITPKTEAVADNIPLHQTALMPIKLSSWTTVAEQEKPRQDPSQHYVLQVRLSAP